jgi:hypothetical protein
MIPIKIIFDFHLQYLSQVVAAIAMIGPRSNHDPMIVLCESFQDHKTNSSNSPIPSPIPKMSEQWTL